MPQVVRATPIKAGRVTAGKLRLTAWSHLFFCIAFVSFFVRRRQFFLVRIDHEHGQQLSDFGVARVLTNAAPITAHFGKAFYSVISNDRLIIELTSVLSFKKGIVDKRS